MNSPSTPIEQHDDLVIWRCPMLGGEVTFRYCRRLLDGLPCSQVTVCWKTTFDIAGFLERHFTPEQLAEAWNRPRPEKVAQLVDLIAKARKSKS